jgi:Tol biopolymer transport system component/tRNA A-37 threonylcarbamoyl transferase component Bud32
VSFYKNAASPPLIAQYAHVRRLCDLEQFGSDWHVMLRPQLPLQPGARLGPYEILSAIGAGGMGDVYRARDTRLDRTVAIKILREAHSDVNPRFAREAKAIAALAHPHICTLFDIGHEGDTDYLVMEFLEGETLGARLMRGPLPLDQALKTAIEIGGALDLAHHAGIVHRDLKPSNVMLTKAGTKLLDFGLAKLVAAGPGSMTMPVTVQTATVHGTIVGTLQYMAPEQLEGREADPRTDLFAFGAVLYEMVTGRRAFDGTSQSSVIAAILETDPPSIRTAQPLAPPVLDRVVSKCLTKDPEARWRTLEWTRTTALVALAAVVVVLAVALGAFFGAGRGTQHETSVRFSVSPPVGAAFVHSFEDIFLALSPDGSQLALVATAPAGPTRIWLRPLSAFDPRPVEGTEGATSLFWSPDGRSLAFFADGKLKRVDLRGNAVMTLCDLPQGSGFTGTWGADGRILFAPVATDAIFSVTSTGGTPAAAVRQNESRGENYVQWPRFLSDGRRFVYIARLQDGSRELMLVEPGKAPRPVLPVASNVEWIDPDYFVFARRDGTLVAQRIDLSSVRVVGEPLLIAQSVDYFYGPGRAVFTVSRNGNVAYQPQQTQQMMWIDRAGRDREAVAQPGEEYAGLRLSPDGGALLFSRLQAGTGSLDLWTFDLRRGVETRLTSDRGNELSGPWLPDGRSVAFVADRGRPPPHLFRKDLATGVEVEWLPAGEFQVADDVSPDGTTLVFSERTRGEWNLSLLALTGSHARSPLFPTPLNAKEARFSPDGRFVAFVSGDSRRPEVYVVPFPTGAKVRVSSEGGASPRWSRDGHELFYLSSDGHLVAVPVRTRPSLELGTPVSLFMSGDMAKRGDFDVSPDGKRFIAVVPGSETPVAVIQHWTPDVGR